MHRIVALILILSVLPSVGMQHAAAQDRPMLSLDGAWEFRFAPDARGTVGRWFRPGTPYGQRVRVPGCWDAQGVGPRTERMNHNAVGIGWYRRTFTLPPAWKGRRVWLVVGGAHRHAEVWVNGQPAARHVGYPVAFRTDITPLLVPGPRQAVVIAVDSRRDPARDPLMGSFDTVDFMDVPWGGLFESVRLEATGDAWIEDTFVAPDPLARKARVTLAWGGKAVGLLSLDWAVRRWKGGRPFGAPLTAGRMAMRGAAGLSSTLSLSLPGAPLWTPEIPNLLALEMTLRENGRVRDRRTVRFGLRRVEVRGRDFYLNGERLFLRGYGDDWTFPVTVSGETGVEAWKRYLRLRKAFGFNGVRHHSCMPPESYLAAADEVGVLVQPELPIAYQPFYEEAARAGSLDVYRRVWAEYIRQMRNHPSVFAWCMGNELPGLPLAPELYAAAKQLDPTRPVIDTDGLFAPTDRATLDYFAVQFPEGTLPWGNTRAKYRLPQPMVRPVLVHEMGNLSVLPDPADIPRYTGGVRPFWLEQMAERVKAQGLEARLPQMLAASRKLQASMLKLNIEAARLSPDVRGYHQWLFRDYWAQSTGFVSQFDTPRALTPAQARRFNGEAVLLWDRDRAAFRAGETLSLRLYLSDYRPARAPGLGPVRVTLGRETVTLKPPARAVGRGLLGPWTGEMRLPSPDRPAQWTLRAEAGVVTNDWPVWVFPAVQEPAPNGAKVVRWLTRRTLDALEQGSSVLLTDPSTLFPTVHASFKPAWWHGDEGDHVYGNMLLPHPALRGFPADGYGDLQMHGMMDGRPVVLLDDVPGRIEPVAWCLDVPWKMRRKGYLFEARVGRGRLLVSSFDFSRRRREQDPAAAWLYARLVEYAGSAGVQPQAELPVKWLRERLGTEEMESLAGAVEGFARVTATTEGRKTWHSYRENDTDSYPVRQTDGRQRLAWRTAPAPSSLSDRKTVTFAWAGGMGWETEPGGGHFTLWVDGAPAVEFPFTTQGGAWRSADGAVSLRYVVRRRLAPDAFGLFLLTVPADRLRPGEPLELAVTATAQNSQRWFGLNPYIDVTSDGEE